MSSAPDPESLAPLERLVAALVDWGAAASQIVAHMEYTRRMSATPAAEPPAEVFRSLLAASLAPMLSGRDREAAQAADLLVAIEEKVREEIYLVPPPVPARRRGQGRRRG